MQGSLLERLHATVGIAAAADAFAGTKTGDVVSVDQHNKVLAIIHKAVGTTGTSTITVQACDNAAGDNPVPITFRYRAVTTLDTPGAITEAAVAGFATGAGSNQLYLIEIDAIDVGVAGKAWCYIKAVEVANDPVLGGILMLLAEPKFSPHTATVIA